MLLRLISLLGLCVFIFLAWTLSSQRRLFPWRAVFWGVALQVVFALFILKTPIGEGVFAGTQRVFDQLNLFALEGARMVFGPLADGAALAGTFGPANGVVFAILITATIILISALSSLLYHWGILQKVVAAMAWAMHRAMGVSGSEALAAASNIFLGQTEAALVIKPYLPRLTRSELMSLMTVGMSTIASGVMVVYAQQGISAGHLLTASFLAAPAGLLMAKIMVPETEHPATEAPAGAEAVEASAVNSFDALCRGASEGVMLSLNIIAMLVAFVAIVALTNALFTGAQGLLGIGSPATLQNVFGWVNAPFAWLMGIPARDCVAIGQVLGERVVLNEFIGYLSLSKQQAQLDPRSYTLATYALCGFANFSSIAIQIGGIGALAPERRGDLARLGFRSMIAGLLACYLTATIVGILI